MHIQPLRDDLKVILKKYGLEKKWNKALTLFGNDIKHPSLRTELLEPRWRGIYSFRLDKKYRALFFIDKGGHAEVLIGMKTCGDEYLFLA